MADDPSMIPDEYYLDGKNFEDVKKLYKEDPLIADKYGHWTHPKITPYK